MHGLQTQASNISHSSSESALSSFPAASSWDELSVEQETVPFLSRVSSESAPSSASESTCSRIKLFEDEADEAKMQLVWLDESDLLNGISPSKVSFSILTSWHITDISPLEQKDRGSSAWELLCATDIQKKSSNFTSKRFWNY